MNPLRYTLFALILMTAALNAQTFEGGITAGMVASQVSGDQSGGYNKLGIYGGPYASFQIRESLRFQMEITYIQKGSTQNPSEDNGYYSYRSKLNYVEVPLMLRYLHSDAFDFELGIAYSVLINSYEELYDVELNERPFYTHNSSLIAGIYYRFTDRWSANFRTSNSITPIRKHKSGQTYRLNFGQTNNLLSLGLFYTI
ncbi:MAG: porin family protein [Bacteroidales bacterium]